MDAQTLIELGVGGVSVLTFLALIGRSAFFNAGKLVQELQETRMELQKQSKLTWAQLNKMSEAQSEFQQKVLSAYLLTHEEARKYLHYHESDGAVATA